MLRMLLGRFGRILRDYFIRVSAKDIILLKSDLFGEYLANSTMEQVSKVFFSFDVLMFFVFR